MSTSKPVINVAELDFDLIKASLKDFLKNSDSDISDYDYEGSAVNILLDILAANTHYNSFYANMVANEMFADSAVLRSSVVSHAKTRGYVPTSARASKATVRVSMTPIDAGVSSIVVPKGTTFTTKMSDSTFNYVTLDDAYLESNGTAYVGNIEIFCGAVYNESFTYSIGQRIVLKNKNIDSSRISVSVQNSISDTTEYVFSNGVRYTSLTPSSAAYFIFETDLGFYELRFGDGKLGKELKTGNIVKVQYLIANTDALKGSKTFTIDSSLYSSKSKTVTIVNRSSGYIEPESIASIKQAIQRIDQTQYRSVVATDFESNLKLDNPDVIDVAVWGGEDNEPPMYGKVFVSPVIRDLSFVPTSLKNKIIADVSKRSVMSVRPVVVEPEVVYCIVRGLVRFSKKYDIQEQSIRGLVESAIDAYSRKYLGVFGGSINPSILSKEVDLAHESIFSAIFDYQFYTEFDIDRYKLNSYSIRFRNEITKGTITSDAFDLYGGNAGSSYVLKDDSLGTIKLYENVNNDVSNQQFVRNVGTINYTTGYINISDFSGTTSLGTILRLYAIPVYSEFLSKQNTILFIDIPESMNKITAIRT